MILERHYDDEALISLLEADRVDADAHLPTCRACSSKLESYRDLSSVLREADVWDTREWSTEPSASSISRIRAFATQMEDEDAQAEGYVAQLLAGSREEWMPRLQQHPEWRTAGVVRKLIERTVPVLMSMPPDGLEMTALSTDIADHLDVERYEAATIAGVRSSAWRDRAYALYYMGSFSESLIACDRAERNLAGCPVDDYDRARISVVRSLVLRDKEDMPGAMAAVRASADTFGQFEDRTRLAAARLAESALLCSKGEYATAAEGLEALERGLRDSVDENTHARVLGNLGYCYAKLGRIQDALHHNEAAAALFDAIGIQTEAARLRWNNATIVTGAGRVEEGLLALRSARKAFDRLGMTSEAALVALDVAELLLARNDFAEVEMICRDAMRSFEVSGIGYSSRALTALAYLQEAAHLRTLTSQTVQHVREYIRRLPQERELLFAPPPL